DAKAALDAALKKWQDQNKKCKDLEQQLAQLQARKSALPGLIKTAEDELSKLKDELEKCKQKAQDDEKKKKAADAGGNTTNPQPGDDKTQSGGGGGTGEKTGQPCNPEGAKLEETKRIYYPCEVDETELTPCNTSKLSNDALEAIKKVFEKFKKL